MPMRSFLERFRPEFEALAAGRRATEPDSRWAREIRS
jgi:hypothetical protein